MRSSEPVLTSRYFSQLNALHFSASKESVRSFMEQTTLSGIHFVRAASHCPKRASVLARCAPSVHLTYSCTAHRPPHSKHFLLEAFPDSSIASQSGLSRRCVPYCSQRTLFCHSTCTYMQSSVTLLPLPLKTGSISNTCIVPNHWYLLH